MAAIRCAAAGRALLRRSPGLLQRAAGGVGQRGLLPHHPIIGAMSPASNRYISSHFADYEKKKLAVELMKERSPNKEIENLDELLNLLKEDGAFTFTSTDQQTREAAARRRAIEDKKLELVSMLLRVRADGRLERVQEYKDKMEELAVLARRHRETLVLEDLKSKYKSLQELQYIMMAGVVIWGLPLTLATMHALSH